jgi:hypothetical protein
MGAGVAALSHARTRTALPTCRPCGPLAYRCLTSVVMDPRTVDPPLDRRSCTTPREADRRALCLALCSPGDMRPTLRLVSLLQSSWPCQLVPPANWSPWSPHLVPLSLICKPSRADGALSTPPPPITAAAWALSSARHYRQWGSEAPQGHPIYSLELHKQAIAQQNPCFAGNWNRGRLPGTSPPPAITGGSTTTTTAKNRSRVGPIATLAISPPFSGHRSPPASSLRRQGHICEDWTLFRVPGARFQGPGCKRYF